MDLSKIVSDFEGSHARRCMERGGNYYASENEVIKQRKRMMYARDTKTGADYLIEDPYKANHKLAAGYFKLLVDQKLQYLIGNRPAVRTKVDRKDPAQVAVDIDALLGPDFVRTLRRAARMAAAKGLGWAQVYIDQVGEYRLAHIPPEQVIPIYAEDDADVLESVVRFYPATIMRQDEAKQGTRAEVWDAVTVTYYERVDGEGEFKLIPSVDGFVNPRPHLEERIRQGENITAITGKSWGRVPFIPLYNDDDRAYDLRPVKAFIDVYDMVESDFANNLEDITDVYWVLKGYDGQNMTSFLDEVRKYKTLKVAEDGDAHTETVQIPTEARQALLDRLNDDIFKFGRGVDTTKTGDGNITNIVIRSRFANLDLKAAEFEAQLLDFIDGLVWFLNKFLEIRGQAPVPEYEVAFNRSLIINETELLDANAKQKGSISEQTRLANHPWIQDVLDEQGNLAAESQPIVLTPPVV